MLPGIDPNQEMAGAKPKGQEIAKPKGQEVAKHQTNFEISLNEYAPQLEAVLPPDVPLARFKRVVITAVNQNPDLYTADRRTLFTACQKAALDGLLPDGREAALVVFRTKITRDGREEQINAVQYLPMVHGICKRMRNTGEILAIDAHPVFKNDDFDYELGDNPFIKHKPNIDKPGELRGAYCIIKLTNGEIIRDVMSVARIEKARAQSRAPNSLMWTKFYDEAAVKTVIRHASKSAPVSSEREKLRGLLEDVAQADEPEP
jgi:recombination protein RecT